MFLRHHYYWVVVWFLLFTVEGDLFNQQPQIVTKNGHIIFQTAENRDITFKTIGSGSIKINNDDLVTITQNAKQSVEEITNIKNNDLVSLQQRVNNLVSEIDKVKEFQERLTLLEHSVNRLTQLVQNTTSARSSLLGRINRNRARVRTLGNEVRNIKNLLNQNECASNPCINGGTCEDAYNGFACRCPPNWQGSTCSEDVNECWLISGTPSGCQNGGTCTNTPGSFSCQCQPDWHGVLCDQRHDDCSSGSGQSLCGHGLCYNTQRVQQGQANYTCQCEPGWKITTGLNPSCSLDEDECNWQKYPCSVNPRVPCYNTIGSYVCGQCPAGYTGNGHNCEDLNECIQSNGGCSMVPMVQCINVPGSRYCGPCPQGFSGDGVTCTQVSACSILNGGCHHLAVCINNAAMIGGRTCRCPQGYSGTGEGPYGCTAPSGVVPTGVQPVPSQNPCQRNPCVQGICIAAGDSFHCLCQIGYTGILCETIISACSSNPCLNGGTCINQAANIYSCVCSSDFTGANCEIQREECGGQLYSDYGELKYPSTSGVEYAHNLMCNWVITVSPLKVVTITFTAMHLENDVSCSFDYVQILDGSSQSAATLGRYCGTEIPSNVTSTHNQVQVTLGTDSSEAGNGFTLQWNATDPTCGGVLQDAEYGSISSPGYPANYPANRDCYWTISVPAGKRIRFQFATMKLEHHENCSYDFLDIKDGLSEESPVLHKYCSTDLHPPLITSGSSALLHFHSDYSGQDTGFQLTFAAEASLPGCGGVFTSPQGSISSPNFPDVHTHNLECDWQIRVREGERIHIWFETMDIERHGTCRWDYVEVRNGGNSTSNLVGRYCGTVLPPAFTSTSNYLFLKFRTDFSFAGKGFKVQFQVVCGGVYSSPTGVIRSPYYPLSYPSERECIYIINQPIGTAILLEFQGFDVEGSSDCRFDYLEARDGDYAAAPLLVRLCGNKIPETIISTHNVMWLKFATDDSVQNHGFEATYTTQDTTCGGIFINATTGVIESPNHGLEYPHGITCKWIIRAPDGFVVRLSFMTFILEASASCNFDYVEIFDNSTTNFTAGSMGRYCGGRLPPLKTTIGNTMMIVFRTDESYAHEGFSAHFMVINASSSCEFNYYTTVGYLKSPYYPSSYPDNRDCTWKIEVPTGQQIELNFTDFDLETSSSCEYDYLEIRNGKELTSPLVGKYCGRYVPFIRSHSNALLLHFHSDYASAGRGFFMLWDGTSTGCGGEMTAISGSIVSPNYPLHYSHNAFCEWHIIVSQGSRIEITIIDLDLETSRRCYYDYLEIRDGTMERNTLLNKFCGDERPTRTIRTTKNSAIIKFRTDNSAHGRGFSLSYRTVCENVVTGHRGIIESPNFPAPYPINRNCSWTIIVPRGNRIHLAFSHMHMETSEDCQFDSLKVLELDQRWNWKLLDKFCNDTAPSHFITSTTSRVKIDFISDSSYAFNGFRLEWNIIGCGGELTRNEGTFESPNFPLEYPKNTICDWVISVAFGQRVQLVIDQFAMEVSTGCSGDSLKIYGGPDTNSPLLKQMCAQTTAPTTITSIGNHMFVRFNSGSYVDSARDIGFNASYKAIEGGCGGNITATTGRIISPNYPNEYDPHTDCVWLITVDDHHTIRINFEQFDVEPHNDCSFDYVAIYDGADENATQLLRHCGTSLPPEIRSTANQVYMRLRADGTVGATGFVARHTIDCGGVLNANKGGIIDFTVDHDMIRQFTNCTWIIKAENPGDRVTLTITHLQLYSGGSIRNGNRWVTACSGSFLRVRDGESSNSSMIGTYCKGSVPPPITSEGPALYVELWRRFTYMHYDLSFQASFFESSSACGGDYTAASGSFNSPQYPDTYPIQTECIWTITASPGNLITLYFSVFELEDSEYCNKDYLEIHENGPDGQLIDTLCGSTISPNMTSYNKLWIKFRSDETDPNVGFMAHYTLVHGVETFGSEGQVASPLYPRYFSASGTFTWKITVPSQQRIQVDFDTMNLPPGRVNYCYGGKLTLYDGGDASTAPKINTYCGPVKPDSIITTGSQLTIVYSSVRNAGRFLLFWHATSDRDIGFTPTIYPDIRYPNSIIETVWIPWNSSAQISSPGYPEGYGSNLNHSWIISTVEGSRLSIVFNVLDLRTYWGECRYYDYIQIFDGINGLEEWNLLNSSCQRNHENISIYTTGHLMKVTFISDYWENGTGFSATVKTVCGGHLYAQNGVIQSPFYPSNYPPLEVCEWRVTVRPSRTIGIQFQTLDIAESTSCSNDYLVLRNGGRPDSPLIGEGKICGNQKPTTMNNTLSNQLYVKFVSGFTISNRQGFKIVYEEISLGCGGSFHLSQDVNSIEIQTPNYPRFAPPYTECEWIVMAPPMRKIQLDFNAVFDIGDPKDRDCLDVYVTVRDGGTQASPSIGRYCGNSAPGTLSSTNNMMFIHYFTNISNAANEGSGFKAIIKIADCGGTIVSESEGIVTSPNHPHPYTKRNQPCEWNIRGPRGHFMSLSVMSLDLPWALNCSTTDNVQLRDFNLENDNILETYCGSNLPPPVNTSDNSALIRFTTLTTNQNHIGFRIAYKMSSEECGGDLRNPSGTITSPNYPGPHPALRRCIWTITVPLGRRIRLEFNAFSLMGKALFRRPDVNFEYCQDYLYVLTGYRSFSPVHGPFCGTEVPDPIESAGNVMTITFGTSGMTTGSGFSLSYTSDLPAICGGEITTSSGNISMYTDNSVISAQCLWKFIMPRNENTSTILTVTNLQSQGVYYGKVIGCRRNFIMVHKDDLITDQIANLSKPIFEVCDNVTNKVVFVIPYPVFNVLYTTIYNNTGFAMTYEMAPCGGVITSPAVLTSPNYPQNYGDNIHCVWLLQLEDAQQIKLQFDEFELENDCSKDYVVIYNGPTPNSPEFGKYCAKPGDLISSSNSLWIEFVSDASGSGRGFKILAAAESSGCGGTSHDNSGQISSLNFPNSYPPNIECVWDVIVPDGFTLTFTFVQRFDIETSNSCTNDYVKILEFIDSQWHTIDTYCGKQMPALVNTSSHQAQIIFHSNSDTQITNDGFKLAWNRVCGGVYDSESGTITSPEYPSTYDDNLDCNYLIKPNGQYLSIKFNKETFSIEDITDCRFDSLEIFRGNSTNAEYIGKYCGTVAPDDIISRSEILLVFKTDSVIGGMGWELEFQIQECGGNLTGPTGTFHPPMHPSQYHANMDCTWVITVETNRIIEIRFTEFDLENSWDCWYDSVSIHDGNSTESYRMAKLCGSTRYMSMPTYSYKSTENKMTVRFLSDSSYQLGGFVAVYRTTFGELQGCGGIMNRTTGTFSSIDWDHNGEYESDLNCTWNIIVPDDKIIKLTFQSFEIEAPPQSSNITGCPWDYLEVRDGLSESSSLINRYCGNVIPIEITSSTNVLWVQFISDNTKNLAGFQAVFESQESVCGGTLQVTNETQIISSPGFPGNYPINLRCQWILSATSQFSIDLRVVQFDLEDSDSCQNDYLDMSDVRENPHWYYGGGLISGIYCGRKIPQRVYSQTSVVRLLFASNSETVSKGFQIQYNIENCNRTYDDDNGVIKYSTYRQNWATVQSAIFLCQMRIIASTNRSISLYFRRVDLNSRSFNDCRNYIQVFDGNSTTAPSVAKSCDWRTPAPVFSMQNELFIIVNVSYGGFNIDLAYTTTDQGKGCGGNFFGSEGFFTSPNYPNTYTEDKTCRFYFQVPARRSVVIEFWSFNVGNSTDCGENYVSLYTGTAENDAFKVGTYCGQVRPARFEGPQGTAILKFVTTASNLGNGFTGTYYYQSWTDVVNNDQVAKNFEP